MVFYKLSVTVILLLFILLISDFRNKKTNPLFSLPWLIFMRIAYLIPPLSFLFFLSKLSVLRIYDFIALIILVFGTIIVAVSKKELGNRHSWAGYAATNTEDFCKSGIYTWIRHPIYLGIIIALIGMAFIVIPNIVFNLELALTFMIGSAITFAIIIFSGINETMFLTKKFGIPFAEYARQVNAYIPIRKFKIKLDGKRGYTSKTKQSEIIP